MITQKKIPYCISKALRNYLIEYGREIQMPIKYKDLVRYENSIPLYDDKGTDTFWVTVFYAPGDMMDVYTNLKKMYAILKSDGDMNIIKHLTIDRIDMCQYGNTKPFRVRVVDTLNDNFDYFYIKNADASRIYGLELEHILSPSQITFYTDGDTLIERHIAGIPGDKFIKEYMTLNTVNNIRLAKEFIKFNERCFLRLLGDMHSSNYVVQIVPDFEEMHYRIRPIDFDQQSYDGRKKVYLPQFYKQNNAIIQLGMQYITPENVRYFQVEERIMMAKRMNQFRYRIKELGDAVMQDLIAPIENVNLLKFELAEHYKTKDFDSCQSMGAIVKTSLRLLLKK